MKFIIAAFALFLAYSSHAFTTPGNMMATTRGTSTTFLNSSPLDKDAALNPEYMKEAAKQMQNMKPGDMDQMLAEMENMNPGQMEQLKSMGMDPEMMKKSMEMMRSNPAMMESVGKMMEQMTPEQMLQQSREAQKQMSKMSQEQIDAAAAAAKTLTKDQISASTDAIVESVVSSSATEASTTSKDDDDDDEKDEEIPIVEGGARDPAVIDTMYRVAELMSSPPTGKVTFHAFSSLPPITLLSGTREEDLSKKELAECWADGSLGSSRVDRSGFERVWMEVQEYFEDDIMDESRKTSTKARRGADTAVVTATPVTPTVGASVPPEVLAEQVKKLSDSDMDMMLDQMSQMTPEEEARMKAMGVDPKMMQRTASMMKNNPLMKKAATAMMKNMSPDQMMKASQQAQQQMSGMSQEDIDKAMDALNKGK